MQHVMFAAGSGDSEAAEADENRSLTPFTNLYKGTVIAAGGFNKVTAEKYVAEKNADLITFGRYWLANPDFPVSSYLPSQCLAAALVPHIETCHVGI